MKIGRCYFKVAGERSYQGSFICMNSWEFGLAGRVSSQRVDCNILGTTWYFMHCVHIAYRVIIHPGNRQQLPGGLMRVNSTRKSLGKVPRNYIYVLACFSTLLYTMLIQNKILLHT